MSINAPDLSHEIRHEKTMAEVRRLQKVLDAARAALAQMERGNVGGGMLNLDRAIQECERDRRQHADESGRHG